MPMKMILVLTGVLVLAACAVERPRETIDVSAELDELLESYFEESLVMNPILATSIGDDRYDDQLPNFLGEEYRTRSAELERKYLDLVQRLDRKLLQGQDRLSYDIFVMDREMALEGLRYPTHLLPINQFFSFPTFFARMGSGQGLQRFRDVQDYDNFLSRIDGFTILADQMIANMKEGMQEGIVQPKVLMEKVLPQLAAHAVQEAGASVFYKPLESFPEEIGTGDRDRLEAAYKDAIMNRIVPAYSRLHDFIRDEYIPRCREGVALSDLPDGKAWYAYRIKTSTTTSLPAEEIHRMGLEEVGRILGEMEQVKARVGFEGDLEGFFRHLETSDQFYFDREEDLLQGYRDLQARINGLLPRVFDIFPASDYEVRKIEEFAARSSAGAFYQAGTPDGSRPGVFYVNTYNLRAQPRYGMETLSLHEASPGHHFQVSIQQEIEDLPRFRRFGGYSAYSEGWALYAESLGSELGLFTDPYQYYGKLSDEQLRAMRLVVDTGLHAKGWTREQAIRYMEDNSSLAQSDIVAEVERYIAIPGQALAYKIGQKVILDLRRAAEQELGDRFDIRKFHREILVDGALPLDVLKTKITEWIAREDKGTTEG